MNASMQIKVRLIGAFRIDRFKEKVAGYPVGTRVDQIVEQLQKLAERARQDLGDRGRPAQGARKPQ